MGEKLSVYSPEGHAPEKYWQRFMVHPMRAYLGDGSDRWAEYAPAFEFYKDLFDLTENIAAADACFLPMAINYYVGQKKLDLVYETCRQAAVHGLKCYIWIEGDFDIYLEIENAVFLKNAGFKSLNKNNEIIRNGDLKKDLLMEYCNGEVSLRSKSDKPTIGFAGLAQYPVWRLVGLVTKNILTRLGYYLKLDKFQPPPVIPLMMKRNKILNMLQKDDDIITNFQKRKAFAVGINDNNGNARSEFISNILNSDYTLCVRGSSNYSLRFYEVMCLGRMPLFLNTDCVLPFEDKIAWKDLILWVDEKDEKYIGKAVRDFHATIKEKEFLERQYECRRIWKEYLSDEGFFRHFIEDIPVKNKTVNSEL